MPVKHLPKHLRPRWRYLAVRIEAWPDTDIDRGDFQRVLWYSGQNLLGDPGSADADLTVVSFSFQKGVGDAVVRARHGHVEDARAAVACVAEVSGDPVGVWVQGISGTIRACEEKYIGRPWKGRVRRTVAFAGEDRTAVTDTEAVDVRVGDSFAGTTQLDLE